MGKSIFLRCLEFLYSVALPLVYSIIIYSDTLLSKILPSSPIVALILILLGSLLGIHLFHKLHNKISGCSPLGLFIALVLGYIGAGCLMAILLDNQVRIYFLISVPILASTLTMVGYNIGIHFMPPQGTSSISLKIKR